MNGKLIEPLFKTIVGNTPLISIDLIVVNQNGQILLGKRLNKPARNFWFVPGGRIFKNEKISEAFSRLAKEELNLNLSIGDGRMYGVYEHFYSDSFLDDNISTHYIVLAYKLHSGFDILKLPNKQHNSYRWFNLDEILTSEEVHVFTKNYFQEKV